MCLLCRNIWTGIPTNNCCFWRSFARKVWISSCSHKHIPLMCNILNSFGLNIKMARLPLQFHIHAVAVLSNKENFVRLKFSQQSLWRMLFPGMLRRVALLRTDISEECRASIIRVTRTSAQVSRSWTQYRPWTPHSIPQFFYPCHENQIYRPHW
jgi:hypothetical protein